MPIFRITIEKRCPINEKFVNTYYVLAADLSEAAGFAEGIADIEKPMHGSTVEFMNAHIDHIGNNTFTNVVLSGNGGITAPLPAKTNIIARIKWGVTGFYAHYKDYRLALEPDNMVGVFWTTGTLLAIDTAAGAFNAAFDGVLCTKAGIPLGGAVAQSEYYFRNVSNKWHNRTGE